MNTDKVEINKRFNIAIDSLLKDKGLTKASIAQSLGMKPSKFSEILNCRMNVGTDTLALLCELYSFNPSWILIGEGPMLQLGEIKGRSKKAISVPKLPEFPMTSEGVCEMFIAILRDKDEFMKEQSEEIGRLKEQIRQLTIEKEKHVSAAHTSGTANVG